MDMEKFAMLIDILRILERSDSPQVAQTALHIIDSYDERMSQDQKAEVLKEFLRFQHKEKDMEEKKHFEEASREEQARSMFRFDYI